MSGTKGLVKDTDRWGGLVWKSADGRFVFHRDYAFPKSWLVEDTKMGRSELCDALWLARDWADRQAEKDLARG